MLCAVAAASLETTNLARTNISAKKPQPMHSTYRPPETLALRRADVSGIRLYAIDTAIPMSLVPLEHPSASSTGDSQFEKFDALMSRDQNGPLASQRSI
jgi:hypothetical protein